DEQFVARFAREAKLAARINNDNVVRVLDVKEKNGIHYLVMEFVKGETARERVKRKGPLKEAEALAVVIGATLGLRDAHTQGIVHRDIKPDNVLVGEDGRIKLADLGLAKQKQSAGDQNLTVLSSGVMGTPQYMPPEQWRTPDVTPAADVWALGATLYYLLVGKSGIPAGEMLVVAERIRDHDFPDVRAARPDVRPEVAAVIAKATARKPEARYADARELLKALRPLAAVDDDLLRDPEAGLGNTRVVTVTPPPRATLARIKLQVEQDPDEVATRAAGLPGRPGTDVAAAAAAGKRDGDSQTQPAPDSKAPGSTVARPVGRSRAGLWAAALCVVAAGGAGAYGWQQGWFATQPAGGTGTGSEVVRVDPPKTAPTDKPTDSPADKPVDKPVDPWANRPKAGDSAGEAPTDPSATKPSTTPSTTPSNLQTQTVPGDQPVVPVEPVEPKTPPPTVPIVDVKKEPETVPKVEAPPVDPAVAAKQALERGLAALPLARGLDTAIEELQKAMLHDSTKEQAKASLALAFLQKARQLEAEEPGKAWLAFGRAAELGTDPEAAVGRTRTQVTLQERLSAAIALQKPAADAVVGERSLAIAGTVRATDCKQVRLALAASHIVDGMFPREQAKVVPVVGGAFVATLPVQADGPYSLRIEAEDARGWFAEARPVAIRVDSTPPVVAIRQPVADARLPGTSVCVVAVDDQTTTAVTVAGQPARKDADGSWSANVTLGGGAQELVAEATDATGRSAKATTRVFVDASKPEIAFDGERPAATNARELAVTGRVRDVTPCALTVGGDPVLVTAQGTFTATLRFERDGERTFDFVARDAVGNESRKALAVRFDGTGPVLACDTASGAMLAPGEFTLAGTVRDDSKCEVRLDGKPVAVDGGRWSATVRIPAGGELAVALAARDELGNEAAPLAITLRGERALVVPAWATPAPGHTRVVIDGQDHPNAVVEAKTGMRFVLVPAAPQGFTMGSPAGEAERGDDEAAHPCTIGKPFWLSATEVTQAQWEAVLGQNPSKQRGADLPVDSVSWNDCQKFLAQWNGGAAGAGFRLPSEGEWEYACRAGTTTPFAFGASIDATQVNFDGSRPYPGSVRSENRKRPVAAGSLPANAFGLCEMHGNVQEWVADVHGAYPATSSEAPVPGDGKRVLRGGAWGSIGSGCRSAYRFAQLPGYSSERAGLRVARDL
ncbi:MAG: SUMF1/EgtB/PvdO family nonheme iron enzyme, partial [Planctomycetes bacterium]|nr:SUMF1/EgtB/PvdO family nonheme iron enzyme [Planctomycetota bacterium]